MNQTEVDAEWAFVGAVITDPWIAEESEITTRDLDSPDLRAILRAIQTVPEPDAVKIADWLGNEHGGNWMPRIIDATQAPGTRHHREYADYLRKRTLRRQAAAIATEMIQDLSSGNDAALDRGIQQLTQLRAGKGDRHDWSGQDCVDQAVSSLTSDSRAITTGFPKVDKILGGFHAGDLIILGARPAVGKTAMLVNLAIQSGAPVGVISTEQGAAQIGERMIAYTGRCSVDDLRAKRVNPDIARVEGPSVFVNDHSAPNLAYIARQARAWKERYGIVALFVDYLQRIHGDSRIPKHERVGEIARGLKTLARDLDIAVVALAQLNRGVEGRADSKPRMSDLKDSGEIEQEADQIMLMYKPDESQAERTEVHLMLDKNRHGPTGFWRLWWEPRFMRFSEA